MTNELEPLKECPFCPDGGDPHGLTHVDEADGSEWYDYVECGRCGARTGKHKSRESAMTAWNVRYKRTCNMVAPNRETMPYPRCSACGAPMLNAPNSFCVQCGAEVVDGD